MKVHVSILVLFFVGAIGVLVSGDSLVPEKSGKVAKRSLILAGAGAGAAAGAVAAGIAGAGAAAGAAVGGIAGVGVGAIGVVAGSAAERLIIQKEFPKLVSFILYTRNTTDAGEKLSVDDVDGLNNSHFDPENPTVIVTHGWRASSQSKSCTSIRDAYLEKGDYNVIVFDWSKLSKFDLIWLGEHVVDIARPLTRMIDFLASQGMDSSQLTVVGHSLGAHIVGLASYYAKNRANYVVALDPGALNLALKDEKSRVSKGDGAYVEVIHTTRFPGWVNQIGDVDFYPNNAQSQNCDIVCSHGRAYEYYAESINSDGFLARSCDSFADYENGKCDSNPIAVMGGVEPDFNVTGRYYLTTNPNPPFARNSV